MNSRSSWTFHIITLGCKTNQYESQSIREAWIQLGGREVDNMAEADIALVNSCAITANAERDTRAALYKLERERPGGLRILTGCAAELLREKPPRGSLFHAVVPQTSKALLLRDPWALLKDFGTPHSPGSLPPSAPSANTAAGTAPSPDAQPDTATGTTTSPGTASAFPPFRISGFKRARPVLKIQDGCSHRCTYCIIPSMRPAVASRPPQEALDETRRLFEAGYREIMISGINLLLYGRDFARGPASRHGEAFWDLIELLDRELAPEWAGRARLRISSLEPRQLKDRGLEVLSRSRMLCPHLHISLQSGSPAILRRMGRGHYSPEDLVEGVGELSRFWPRFGLGADILMGFPGETETHVRETLELVERVPFTYAHVFPYSSRPGTAAARFPGQLPRHEKAARAARVRALIEQKQRAGWKASLSLPEVSVAIDSPEHHKEGAFFKGIDECYTPCLLESLPPMANPHSLLRARPLRLSPQGVIVAAVPS